MLKQSLEYSEGYIYWVRAKANDVASRTGLNQPLKQLEAVASMGMQRMEQKRSEAREWETFTLASSITSWAS